MTNHQQTIFVVLLWLAAAACMIVAVLMADVALGGEPDYSAFECPAYSRAQAENLHGIVIVSARWCGGCQALKSRLHYYGIGFIEVDVDRHPRTAKAIIDPGTIPQVFAMVGDRNLHRVVIEVREVNP